MKATRSSKKSTSKISFGPLEITLASLIVAAVALGIGVAIVKFNSINGSGNHGTVSYAGKEYYIYNGKYTGEYDIQEGSADQETDDPREALEGFKNESIMDLAQYAKYCKKWGLKQKYTDQDYRYIVISDYSVGANSVNVKLGDLEINNTKATAYVYDDFKGVVDDTTYFTIVIPVSPEIVSLEVKSLFTQQEFENIKKYGFRNNPNDVIDEKPIIYLYPETDTELTVTLGSPDRITVSYPKYQDGWHVLARPDGTLTDLETDRELYSLYWENTRNYEPDLSNGFIVKGEDSAKFLEEKLALLGLNSKETEEFIVYWLPRLESSPYNLIKFEDLATIEQDMALIISADGQTVNPDTLIRVRMVYEPLSQPIDIVEQELTPAPARQGFTVVEWGGAEV